MLHQIKSMRTIPASGSTQNKDNIDATYQTVAIHSAPGGSVRMQFMCVGIYRQLLLFVCVLRCAVTRMTGSKARASGESACVRAIAPEPTTTNNDDACVLPVYSGVCPLKTVLLILARKYASLPAARTS